MRLGARALLLVLVAAGTLTFLYAQKEFAEYPGQNNAPLPPDYKQPREYVWGRLRYPDAGFGGGGGFGGRRGGGRFGRGAWSTDYSKGDRVILQSLSRLTRVDARSVEQVIDLDGTDDIYNWPFLYAVEVGRWELDDDQAKQLRDFINRGGFFMVDDFHGEYEWDVFMESFRKVFPDADVVDIPQSDAINQIVTTLDQSLQIPGRGAASAGLTYERADGFPGHWRGVYDKSNRLVVTIVHNSDLGDAVEYADDPYYPAEYAQQALRIVSNYIVYDLTH